MNVIVWRSTTLRHGAHICVSASCHISSYCFQAGVLPPDNPGCQGASASAKVELARIRRRFGQCQSVDLGDSVPDNPSRSNRLTRSGGYTATHNPKSAISDSHTTQAGVPRYEQETEPYSRQCRVTRDEPLMLNIGAFPSCPSSTSSSASRTPSTPAIPPDRTAVLQRCTRDDVSSAACVKDRIRHARMADATGVRRQKRVKRARNAATDSGQYYLCRGPAVGTG